MRQISKQTIQRLQGPALAVAMLMIAVAAAMPILGIAREHIMALRYVFAAGAALAFIVRLTETYDGSNTRLRRLHRLERMSALLYCVSAFLLFFYGDSQGGKDWIAFLLAGAVMQIYSSYMIQYEQNKENKKNEK